MSSERLPSNILRLFSLKNLKVFRKIIYVRALYTVCRSLGRVEGMRLTASPSEGFVRLLTMLAHFAQNMLSWPHVAMIAAHVLRVNTA